jgi:hypothetical protein
VLYNDGKDKTVEEKMSDPDLEDTLSIAYVLDESPAVIENEDQDPGRIRSDVFFKSIYGVSATTVARR